MFRVTFLVHPPGDLPYNSNNHHPPSASGEFILFFTQNLARVNSGPVSVALREFKVFSELSPSNPGKWQWSACSCLCATQLRSSERRRIALGLENPRRKFGWVAARPTLCFLGRCDAILSRQSFLGYFTILRPFSKIFFAGILPMPWALIRFS